MPRLLYFPQLDERPTPLQPLVDDSDSWWAGTAVPTIIIAILQAAVVANALTAQIITQAQVDDIPPAGSLYGQPDEDYWINYVAPSYPANLVPNYALFEQNEIPPRPLAPDEDFWFPPKPYDWRPPPVGFMSNEDEIAFAPPLAPDDDHYIPPLPYDWRPPITGFSSNEDEIAFAPPPLGIDDDPLIGLVRLDDPLLARKLPLQWEDTDRPRTGLETTVKNFSVTLGGVGSTVVIPHGLLAKPQVIIVTLSGRTESVDTNGQASYKKGLGVAIQAPGQPITQRTWGTHSDDAQALTQSSTGVRSDCVACIMETGASPYNTKGRLSVLSIDLTNVTFRIDEVFELDVRAQVQFVAGSDFTHLSLADYAAPAAPGTQSINVAFRPDFLFLFGGHTSGSPPADENDSSTFMGAVDKNLNQWVLASGCNEAGGTGSGRAKSYARAGESICILDTTVQTPDCRGQVSALTATGFDINWTKITTTSGRRFIALAIQGANWAVGNFLSQLGTAEAAVVTGLTFRPIGEILASAAKVASTVDTLDNDEQWSVSLNQDVTVRHTQAVAQQNQVAPTVVSTAIEFSDSYLALNVAGTVRARAAVSSIQSSGFSFKHSAADSIASFIGYIAFAPIAQASLQTVIITVKPQGGGDYLNLATALASEVVNHRNLVSQNILLEFDCYRGLDTLAATIPSHLVDGVSGYITDRDHYIIIKAVEGHVGLPDETGTKYLLSWDAGGTTVNGLKINAENVRLVQMQVKLTANASTPSGYRVGALGALAPIDIRWINCIQFGDYSGTFAGSGFRIPVEADGADAKYIFVNCIVYDCLNLELVPHGFNNSEFALGGKVYFYNCTTYNCNTGWFDRTTAVNKNCAAVYNDNGWRAILGAPHPDSQNNVSTNSDSPNPDAQGPNSVNKATIFMVDPINNDIRPEGGDTGLTGLGVSLYADPVFPFNFDVAGNVRTIPWTVGAFQAIRPDVQRVRWFWVGGASPTGAKIHAKLNQAEAVVKLRVSTDPLLATYTLYGPVATNADGIAIFAATVVPDTVHYYQVEIGGVPTLGPIGRFRSFPTSFPMSFSIACGGCSDFGSNSNVFNRIRDAGSRVFIEYGDLHYANIAVNDPALYRAAYEHVMLTPKRRALYDTVARDYVWDDHDYGPPNSDGFSVSKPAAQATSREVVPAYTLPGLAGQIYHSFVLGRLRCIVTDLRSERSDNNDPDTVLKTMMGTEQKAWFKSELLTAKALGQVVLWFSSSPWIAVTNDGSGEDDWGGHTVERRELSDFIQANDLEDRMFIVTGDMHAAIIDNGEHNLYTTDGLGNRIPIFGPFPLNQRGDSYTGSVWTQGPVEPVGIRLLGKFGLITVTDDGTSITLQFDVIDERGVVMTMTVTTPAHMICIEPSTSITLSLESSTAMTLASEASTPITITSETPTPTVCDD